MVITINKLKHLPIGESDDIFTPDDKPPVVVCNG